MTDTKNQITPMAFAPDPALLNTPLARPWRRGLAMLFDLTVLAFFSSFGENYFVLMLVLLALFRTRWGKRAVKLLGAYQNRALRVISLLVVALALIGNAIYLVNRSSGDAQGPGFGAIEVLASGFTVIKAKSCQDASCWQPYVDDLIVVGLSAAAEDNTLSAQELVKQVVDEVVADSELAAAEINRLKKMVNDRLAIQLAQNKLAVEKSPGPPAPMTEIESSPLAWVYSLLNDLGLGFGFSAVYFSCFTAWFSGQTLGKKLLNIQVIQLNNTPLSLWDAFGRYGGYGAGLATGLLGFVQIYWDDNRQAIQDKIAATVVIDLGLVEKGLIEKDLVEKGLIEKDLVEKGLIEKALTEQNFH